MRLHTKVATIAAAAAVAATPTVALGQPGGSSHKPPTPGPKAGMPAKAKAYGRFCQGESKKHVKGQKGTPFSTCVTDMAKLAKGTTHSPAVACQNESKKHVKGQKGTPFSLCVAGGKKLLKTQG